MWRVHRLDQINATKPANLLDFRSLTLNFRSKLIGRFFYVYRQLDSETALLPVGADQGLRCDPWTATATRHPGRCPGRPPRFRECGARKCGRFRILPPWYGRYPGSAYANSTCARDGTRRDIAHAE